LPKSKPENSKLAPKLTHPSRGTMSLFQLQELASRQQKQIESTHRLILNKEQSLNYLASMKDSQQWPLHEYDQNVNHFKEKISLQEARLQKLRLLKGQMQKQRCSNSNMCKSAFREVLRQRSCSSIAHKLLSKDKGMLGGK